MEKFASDVKNLLEQELFLFKSLKKVFQKEQHCIVNIDIDSLWHTIKEKKDLGLKIRELKEQLLSLFEEESVVSGVNREEPFNLSGMIEIMSAPGELKSEISGLKTLIVGEMEEIKALAEVNSNHVNSYLLVVDDVFSTIMDVTEKSRYDTAGPYSGVKKGNCLIRQEV